MNVLFLLPFAKFSYQSMNSALAFYNQWQTFGLKFSARSGKVKSLEFIIVGTGADDNCLVGSWGSPTFTQNSTWNRTFT